MPTFSDTKLLHTRHSNFLVSSNFTCRLLHLVWLQTLYLKSPHMLVFCTYVSILQRSFNLSFEVLHWFARNFIAKLFCASTVKKLTLFVVVSSILKLKTIFKCVQGTTIQIKAGFIFTFLNEFFPETFTVAQ